MLWWGPASRLLPASETLAVPKNTTGVMFERPGASWRHPGATKHTTSVVFGPSQAVLDSSGGASHSVQERPGGLQECPRASWCILEASRNVFQALPGRFQGHKKQ